MTRQGSGDQRPKQAGAFVASPPVSFSSVSPLISKLVAAIVDLTRPVDLIERWQLWEP
jgi:hypothetical protein